VIATIALVAGLAAGPLMAQTCDSGDVIISSNITTSQTWTADNEYCLSQVIYVTNGATLTIEGGTVIRGEPESGTGTNDPGALVITRGSKIQVLGTMLRPVVFTDLEDDNVGHNPGTYPYDTAENANQIIEQWGGLILLGRGYVANDTASGPDPSREVQIEGLTAAGGLGLYGNCNAVYDPVANPQACDDDDSGLLRYFSIRYGGFNLAEANEINGLTLGGVGRETDIEYGEVFQNKDDGVEFFGGAANIKHFIMANVGDDSIDYDEGWRGKAQFIFVMQGIPGSGTDKSDKGGEHDGANSPDSSLPMGIPTLYNVTFIGHGQKQFDGNDRNTVVHMRDNAGGRYYNSFAGDWGGGSVLIEGTSSSGTGANSAGERSITPYVANSGHCSGVPNTSPPPDWIPNATSCTTDADCPVNEVCVYHYLPPASTYQLEWEDNDFWCIDRQETNNPTLCSGDCTAWGGDSGKVHYDNGLFSNGSLGNNYYYCYEALPIRTLVRTDLTLDPTKPDQITLIDPRPTAGSVLWNNPRPTPTGLDNHQGFFEPAPYKGAFGDHNWAEGWTTMARLGYFPPKPVIPKSTAIAVSETWVKDNEYLLTNPVYLTNGATLTIEPGTVIRGEPESGTGTNDPGALIVTRGTKINAVGTEEMPIVFTDEYDDNIDGQPGYYPYDTPENANTIIEQWGGVIILGRGYVANDTASGPDPSREVQIEGLTAAGGLGLYGNCNAVYNPITNPEACDDDDSGEMKYFSIRYGGFNLAEANEINGLTLGGVGRETDIEYGEVFQNKDDGVEFFGGAANIKRFVMSSVGDDSIDYDEGWRGKGQYIFVMQGIPGAGTDKSDKGGEHDGANSPDSSLPMGIPTLYNVTFIGHGQKQFDGNDRNTVVHMRDNAGGRYYNSFAGDWGGASVLIEGTSSSGTGANSAGERSITPYVANSGHCSGVPNPTPPPDWIPNSTSCTSNADCPSGEVCVFHYLPPASTYQLEWENNDFWCIDRQETNNPTLCSGDCTAWGGDSGKVHHDNGLFSNPALSNVYSPCDHPRPIRDLVRTDLTLDSTKPDQITTIDPRPASASILWPNWRLTPQGPDNHQGFFEPALHKSAFAGRNWAHCWTNMSRLGYFPTCPYDEVDGFTSVAKSGTDAIFYWNALPSCFTVKYDLLRSSDPDDFTTATYIEDDDYDTTGTDGGVPTASYGVYHYLVRADNLCDGLLGYERCHGNPNCPFSDGTEREGP
jgi:hypothetical protein